MKKIIFSLVIVSILSGIFFMPQGLYACSCVYREDTKEQVQTDFDRVSSVFSGKVVSVSENTGKIEFEVEQSWKGPSEKSFTIKGAGSSAACGWNPEVGKEYVIYAGYYDGDYQTSLCEPNHEPPLTDFEKSVFGEGKIATTTVQVNGFHLFFSTIRNIFASFFSLFK